MISASFTITSISSLVMPLTNSVSFLFTRSLYLLIALALPYLAVGADTNLPWSSSPKMAMAGITNFSFCLSTNGTGISDVICQRAQTKAKFVLRRGGVKIVEDAYGEMIFTLYVQGFNDASGFTAYHVKVSVAAPVALVRRGKPQRFVAELWWAEIVGVAETKLAGNRITERVEELCEGFANEYLAAQIEK